MTIPRCCLPVLAVLVFSAQADPTLDEQAAKLRTSVQQAPRLALHGTQVKAPGYELGYPSSVTADRKGNIYVLHRGEASDPVIVIGRDGRVVRTWGKGMYKIPHSIRVDPQGNIWTTDAQSSMIYKFTPLGEKLMEISVGGQPPTKSGFNGTTDIAFAPNGHLFISDGYGNARVLEYSADGKRIREWGSAGTGPGQFHQPHGIAIDENGVIYVADRQNGRLQRFDLNGKFLGSWDDLGMVTSVTFARGALWISTQQRNEPTGADGWLMKIDRSDGRILGWTESAHGHHFVNVTGEAELLSGARPDSVWWFRKGAGSDD
jgi:DNA-binding beta-propeller fold protein YncE